MFLCRKFAIARREAADAGVRGLPAAQGRPFFLPPAPLTAHGAWLVGVAPAISMAAPPTLTPASLSQRSLCLQRVAWITGMDSSSQ